MKSAKGEGFNAIYDLTHGSGVINAVNGVGMGIEIKGEVRSHSSFASLFSFNLRVNLRVCSAHGLQLERLWRDNSFAPRAIDEQAYARYSQRICLPKSASFSLYPLLLSLPYLSFPLLSPLAPFFLPFSHFLLHNPIPPFSSLSYHLSLLNTLRLSSLKPLRFFCFRLVLQQRGLPWSSELSC